MKTNPKDLEKSQDKSFTLKLTLAKNDIEKEYENVLKQVSANFEQKGFRKGNVPRNIVEANISQSKVFEEIMSHLLSHLYSDKIKEYELRPIVQPQIKILNPPVELGKDWEFEVKSCELPEIKIKNDYKETIKKIKSSVKTKKDEKADDNKVLDKVFDALIKDSAVDLPEILVENEIQAKISNLIEQTTQANISIQDFFKSKNTTLEKYREMLSEQVKNDWKLNLVMDKIAQDEKIEVTEDEAKSFLAKNPQFQSNVNLVYIILQQQKVVDFIQKL